MPSSPSSHSSLSQLPALSPLYHPSSLRAPSHSNILTTNLGTTVSVTIPRQVRVMWQPTTALVTLLTFKNVYIHTCEFNLWHSLLFKSSKITVTVTSQHCNVTFIFQSAQLCHVIATPDSYSDRSLDMFKSAAITFNLSYDNSLAWFTYNRGA